VRERKTGHAALPTCRLCFAFHFGFSFGPPFADVGPFSLGVAAARARDEGGEIASPYQHTAPGSEARE